MLKRTCCLDSIQTSGNLIPLRAGLKRANTPGYEYFPGKTAECLYEIFWLWIPVEDGFWEELEHLNGIATDKNPCVAHKVEDPEESVHQGEGDSVIEAVNEKLCFIVGVRF